MPAPLPAPLEWDDRLASSLARAAAAVGELTALGRMLPNPHLLIGPFLRREAVLSSRIEGTQATVGDLLLFEAEQTSPPQPPDVREVSNHVRAIEYGLRRIETLPIGLRLFREMHEILLKGVRGQEHTPGEFRRSQNWIGPPGCTLNEATYVPPPWEMVIPLLGDLERYIHRPNDLHVLVRLGLVHYQFEAIHPFLDGNGRIGRLLITLLMCAEGLLSSPLLYVSAFFERHRDEYYRRLLEVSRDGRWNDWLLFFLRAIEDQARDTVRRSDRLLTLRTEWQAAVQATRTPALLLRLIDHLFDRPSVTVGRVASLLHVTPQTAQKYIDRCESHGILEEVTGRKRGRVWAATAIRDAIQ